METGSSRNRGLQKTYLVDGKNVTACKMRIISLNIVGLLRKEMAVVLDVKSSTIDSHFNRIYKPLTLYRGRQLVTWSLKNGFDEMDKLER
jgi:DNA-binding NarL/FixJ family response regulator